MNECKSCGKETENLKFCSRSCSATHTNTVNPKRKRTAWKTGECRGCGKTFQYRTKQSNGFYCSNKCQQDFQHKSLIQSWLENNAEGNLVNGRLRAPIRNYLIEKSGKKCSICGWNQINPTTNKCPLEIDHIDGNADNCRPENLRVLCPNCHSLTPTWKALNSGNGSKKRLKYGKLIH
jgi:hypothetical protein